MERLILNNKSSLMEEIQSDMCKRVLKECRDSANGKLICYITRYYFDEVFELFYDRLKKRCGLSQLKS